MNMPSQCKYVYVKGIRKNSPCLEPVSKKYKDSGYCALHYLQVQRQERVINQKVRKLQSEIHIQETRIKMLMALQEQEKKTYDTFLAINPLIWTAIWNMATVVQKLKQN